MRQKPKIFVILTGAVALASCDPRRFDDLAAKAPVQAAETPEGLAAFGQVAVAPTLEGGAEPVTAMAVVAGEGSEALVSIHVLSDGTLDVSSGGDMPGFWGEVTGLALAAPKSGPDAGPPRPTLLVGIPATWETGGVYLAVVDPLGHLAALENVQTLRPESCRLNEPNEFGAKVGAGDLDGDGRPDDWAVLSRDRVCFFPDEDPNQYQACQVPVCDNCTYASAVHRSLLVADLLGDGSQEVAVGIPDDETGGRVAVYTHDATGSPCPAGGPFMGEPLILTAPNQEPTFGWALAAAPLGDATGPRALLAAAPDAGKVYVYDLRSSQEATPVSEISYPEDTAGSFGQALLVTDLLGDEHPELVVGAPESPVDGNEAAGQVLVFQGTGPGAWASEPAVVLSDFEPERTHRFGKALTALEAGDLAVLVVVSDEAVFTYPSTFLQKLSEAQ